AIAHYRRVVDLYAGELLPEEGPAEWLLDERELRRSELCEAALGLAELLLAGGEALSAALDCVRAIRVQPVAESLWRTCALAYETAGDAAAAEQTRRRYQSVLAELGLGPARH